MIPMCVIYRSIVGRLVVVLYHYINIILGLSFFVTLNEFLNQNCCLAQSTNCYNHDVKDGNNDPWLKTIKKNGKSLGPNSPGPIMDDWKVTDDSSINFHDGFFFIFCQIIAKNEEKHVMEIYG